MAIPPSAPAEKKKNLKRKLNASECTSAYSVLQWSYLGPCDQYLVDGKSNGEESSPLLTLLPSTFLHQSDNDRASPLPVLWIVILLIQLQPILRVGPECVCKTQKYKDDWINIDS